MMMMMMMMMMMPIAGFSYQTELMVFHSSLSDRKSRQFSRSLLSILVNLTNAVVWFVGWLDFMAYQPLQVI